MNRKHHWEDVYTHMISGAIRTKMPFDSPRDLPVGFIHDLADTTRG